MLHGWAAEDIARRRKQTLKTLGKVQGVDVSEDGSSVAAPINLKLHECTSPAIQKGQDALLTN